MAKTGKGTSLARTRLGSETGVPLARTGITPPQTGTGVPPGQNSRMSTCCATGGMSLAVTQEDLSKFIVGYLSYDVQSAAVPLPPHNKPSDLSM